MKSCVKYFESRSKDVRTDAHNLALEIYKIKGEEFLYDFFATSNVRKNPFELLQKDIKKLKKMKEGAPKEQQK